MYNVAEFTEFILVAVIAVIAVVYFCLQLPKSILWSHKKTICYKYCTYYNTRLVKLIQNWALQKYRTQLRNLLAVLQTSQI